MPTPFGPLSGRKMPAIVSDVNKRERSFISAGRDFCPWLLRLALVASLWNSNSFGRFQVFVVSGGKRSFVVSSTKENWPFARCRLSPVSGLRFSSLFSCFPISTIFFVFGTFFRLVVPSLVFHLFVLTGVETGGTGGPLIVKGLHIRSCHHR